MSPPGQPPPLDAVVLAGGRSTRLGGQDKATLLLHGARLVDRAVAAARAAGARRCVVVGPRWLEPGVMVVQERPPFGGPVAGLAAGLAGLGPSAQRSTAVLVLACDLAEPVAAVSALTAVWASGVAEAGAHLVDESGRPQWLTGIYLRSALDAAFAELGEPAGRSARQLLSGLALREVGAPASTTADIDTWEDLSIARRRRARGGTDE